MKLSGKIAVVTGSGGEGSGRAEAVRLASEGCCVLISDINDSGGNETVRRITLSGGKAAFHHCNVSRPEEVGALVAFAEETFGGLDILINNASGPGYKPGAPPEEWLSTIEVDLLGAIYGLRYALPSMRKRGGGAVVNVSSTSALTHSSRHSGMTRLRAPDASPTRQFPINGHLHCVKKESQQRSQTGADNRAGPGRLSVGQAFRVLVIRLMKETLATQLSLRSTLSHIGSCDFRGIREIH